jgi:hypothetical protein
MYIIKRTSPCHGYVARPGSAWSYTNEPQKAWIFKTKEEAEQQRCPENETVVPLNSLFNYNY